MSIVDFVAIAGTIGGATWAVSQKIDRVDDRASQRLSMLERDQTKEAGERRLLDQRLQRMEDCLAKLFTRFSEHPPILDKQPEDQ